MPSIRHVTLTASNAIFWCQISKFRAGAAKKKNNRLYKSSSIQRMREPVYRKMMDYVVLRITAICLKSSLSSPEAYCNMFNRGASILRTEQHRHWTVMNGVGPRYERVRPEEESVNHRILYCRWCVLWSAPSHLSYYYSTLMRKPRRHSKQLCRCGIEPIFFIPPPLSSSGWRPFPSLMSKGKPAAVPCPSQRHRHIARAGIAVFLPHRLCLMDDRDCLPQKWTLFFYQHNYIEREKKLTVNDHGPGGDGLLFHGGHFASIDAAELVGRLQNLQGSVPFVRIVGGHVIEIETAFEDAEILRPFPRYPLVHGTGAVLEIPLDDQFRFLIGRSEDVVAVQDHRRRRAVFHHRRHPHIDDLQHRTGFRAAGNNRPHYSIVTYKKI